MLHVMWVPCFNSDLLTEPAACSFNVRVTDTEVFHLHFKMTAGVTLGIAVTLHVHL
jgi:hypothetical protein